MKPLVTFRKAIEDPNLLGGALEGTSWLTWRALLLAMMGEPLTPEELEAYQSRTGRRTPPTKRVDEFWTVAGRRGGKTRSMSTVAVYLGALVDYSDVLVPGERGVIPLIAPDKVQARVALDYATGLLEQSPLLSQRLADRTAETLRLTTGIDIEVRSASFRRLRGLTSVAALADEAAFWLSEESTNPDKEILDALRPSLITTKGPLVVISSPYARRGAVWETYSRHFGSQGSPKILVAHGASRDFNPSLPQSVINEAMERDPAWASAEYLGQFRTDVENFLTREAIEACISPDVHERPPERRNHYVAFVDPSGGSADSMTLGIAHTEGRTQVLDVLRERRPPFMPEPVVDEFASLIRSYRCTTVYGDRYAGEWPREQFQKRGVHYEPSEKPKSDIYRDLLPLINSAAIDLLDNQRLINQLITLERRTARGGKDSIDHPRGGHDDVANAAAGALVTAFKEPGALNFSRPLEYPELAIV